MRPRGAAAIAWTALGYLAAARVALLFAIPPGYSTIVWPASGVALAAVWACGSGVWPGVLLGSFAANAWMTWSRGFLTPKTLALSAWIAVGAAAQALVAAALARRATKARDPLSGESELFGFLVAAGPVACLVSSLWATAGMRALGVIGDAELAFSWATWWTGDAIGVATGAPLVLLWLTRPDAASRRGRAAATAVLATIMASVATLQIYAIRNEEASLRAAATQKLEDLSLTMRVGLAGHIETLQSTADLFASDMTVDRRQFGRFARGLIARHPGIQALEWRPRVVHADRAAVEARARGEGLKDFQFVGLDETGRTRRREAAPTYFPILYAEPLEGNEVALGLDINRQQPAVHDAAVAALASGKPTASAAVRLIQETAGQAGVAVIVPVLDPRGGPPRGLVEGVFRVGDMMESLLAGVDRRTLGVAVWDESPGAVRELYERPATEPPFAAPLSVLGDFAGRRWRIELTPSVNFQSRERVPLSWFVLGASLAFSFLTAWVVLSLNGRGEWVTALVERRTAELRENERRLMHAQRMESVGRLAGGVAHEFNNILMAAGGLAQIVLQALGPKHPSAPDLEGIIGAVGRAGRLVGQLLTYSRRREATPRPIDLGELVERSAKMIRPALGSRVELEVAHSVDGAAWVLADAAQVEQVLLNLCFNARDALGGKGRVRLAVRQVTLPIGLPAAQIAPPPGRYAAMEVVDDGPGIAPEILPRLLEPFFTTKPFGEGSGLGLSVVSGIVRAHRGGLDIRSEPGRGATFAVYWPSCDAPDPEATPTPAPSVPRGEGTVLIVDDEPLMRPLLKRLVEERGYRALVAGSGMEALAILEAHPETRGAILDLLMPGMDGLETHERMRAARPDLKVLFLSGYAPREVEEEAARRGVPFLAKPADPEQLARALHDLLGAPRA